jgi:2-polyprenyl-3-methyl-5-hydroxy-6-metoxy-1,4-benzoquinol methylase
MKPKKPWYRELFEDYAESYDREPFTRGTAGEADFIEREIRNNREYRILDIGCGTGRHSIELARRGYRVTGIDLSASQIKKAREKAARAEVDVQFMVKDAVALNFNNEYDLALVICEGAFALMETDEKNYLILQNASRALRLGGKLILTTLNGLYPLFHSVKNFIDAHPGGVSTRAESFDLMTFRNHSSIEMKDDSGKIKKLDCNERHYVPSEMTWLLKSAGFKTVDIFGCPLGAFSRDNPLTAGDFEMLVVAEKR